MKLIIIAVVLIIGAFVLYQRDLSKQEAAKEAQRIEQEERELQRIKEEKALLLEKERIEKEKVKKEAERKKEEEHIRKENELKAKQEEERKIAEQKKAEEQKQLEIKIQKEKEEAERLVKEKADLQKKLDAQCPECSGTGKVSQTAGRAVMKVDCPDCNGTGEKQVQAESHAVESSSATNPGNSVAINKMKDEISSLESILKDVKKFKDAVYQFKTCRENEHHFSTSLFGKKTNRGTGSTGSKGQINRDYYWKGIYRPMRDVYRDWEETTESIAKDMKEANVISVITVPLRSVNKKCMHNVTPSYNVPEIDRLNNSTVSELEKYIKSKKNELNKLSN